ncbi:MAG: hypothetical protein JXB26_16735 [Candidatus Aminicenantes bacterium]|nr:hypothetical protein [Candidatus Aminicenantes bacterium]
MKKSPKKKKYEKPDIEHQEKINRVFLACRNSMAQCTSTLQSFTNCPT